MCSVSIHPSHSHSALLFHMSPCGNRKTVHQETKRRSLQKGTVNVRTDIDLDVCTVGRWAGRNTPYIAPLWGKLNINSSFSEPITRVNESEGEGNLLWLLPKLCLIGLLIWLVPSQPDSATSIFEELMYTGKVAKVSRLLTTELHIHYMYNWKWIWSDFH